MASTSFPSLSLKNSPFSLSSFSAFHCLGLWLAVMMIPPQAPSFFTAISVVGVVARPMLTTSMPTPHSVPLTMLSTIGPDRRASRPTTILLFFTRALFLSQVANAEVNFTISRGVRLSSTFPPMVPLIPEMDFINVISVCFCLFRYVCTLVRIAKI